MLQFLMMAKMEQIIELGLVLCLGPGVGTFNPEIRDFGTGLEKNGVGTGRDGGFQSRFFSGRDGMGFFNPDFFGTGRD